MLPLRIPFKDSFADIWGEHTPKYGMVFQLFHSMFSTKMENFGTFFCSSFFWRNVFPYFFALFFLRVSL